jgi:hypothetical protein
MAEQEAELQANLERLREAVREKRLRRSLRSAVQKEFLCPIAMTTFCDPVIAADGHSYERSAIEAWLQQHNTSPLTNLQLPHKHLVPNRAIKSAIASIMAAGGGINKAAGAGAGAGDEASLQGAQALRYAFKVSIHGQPSAAAWMTSKSMKCALPSLDANAATTVRRPQDSAAPSSRSPGGGKGGTSTQTASCSV